MARAGILPARVRRCLERRLHPRHSWKGLQATGAPAAGSRLPPGSFSSTYWPVFSTLEEPGTRKSSSFREWVMFTYTLYFNTFSVYNEAAHYWLLLRSLPDVLLRTSKVSQERQEGWDSKTQSLSGETHFFAWSRMSCWWPTIKTQR